MWVARAVACLPACGPQGPLLAGELQLKRLWRRAGLRPVNVWLGRAITIALLLALADPFFFAPVDRDSELADLVTAQASMDARAWCGPGAGRRRRRLGWPPSVASAGKKEHMARRAAALGASGALPRCRQRERRALCWE